MKKFISAVINPTRRFRKIYLRTLSIMTVVFILGMIVILPMNASAASTSSWSSPDYPEWKATGFTSKAEYEKAVSQHFYTQDGQFGIKFHDTYDANDSSTLSKPKVYEMDGFTSQDAMESYINAGKYFNPNTVQIAAAAVNGAKFADGTQCLSDTSPAVTAGMSFGTTGLSTGVEEEIVEAAELSGAKFTDTESMNNFVNAFLDDFAKDIDNVDSDVSKAMSSDMGKTAAQIQSGLDDGSIDWGQILSKTSKTGFIALAPAALAELTRWIGGFAGQGNAVTGRIAGFGNVELPANISESDSQYWQESDGAITANNSYSLIINPLGLSNGCKFVADLYLKNSGRYIDEIAFSFGSTSTAEKISFVTTGNSYMVYLNDSYFITRSGVNFPDDIIIKYFTGDSSVNVTSSLTNGSSVAIGDYSAVKPNATTQNTAYPNTWQNPETPGWGLDTSKSTGLQDQVGTTAKNVADNPHVKIVTGTATANTTAGDTPSTTPVSTDPSTAYTKPSTGLDFTPLEVAMDKFPFCIPWDLVNGIKTMVAPGVEPSFTVVFPSAMLAGHDPITKTLKPITDLGNWSIAVAALKWFLSLGWTYFLILKTRDLVRG